jgi:hypothetical protein
MCQNAQKTLVNLMAAIEPSIIALGNQVGISSNPLFKNVITAYNAALTVIENWKSGTVAQDVIQVLNDLQSAVSLLPIPTNLQMLLDLILGGVATVIAVVTANSPAPTPIPTLAGDATVEETQAMHQAQVIAELTAKLQTLAPNFKRSIFHSAATQYKNAWNDAVKSNKLPTTLVLV